MLVQIVVLTLVGSVLSLLGGFVLLIGKTRDESFVLKLTSFAAGVLLATAFLDLFPEALESSLKRGGGDIFLPALGGIILFFLLERTLFWFHHHHAAHGIKPTIWMVTLGDGVHNFIDGVAIAATFLINPTIGLTTALAVAAHEIPQEIADFSILLSRGLSKKQAILFNLGSSLTALFGAVGMYFFSQQLESYLSTIAAFTAGMFAYISLSDLIPELHHAPNKKDTIHHIVTFIGGILLVFFLKSFLGEIAP